MKSKQPLTDVTNSFNLIPLSTLRKLCESTNNSNKKKSSNSKPFNNNNNNHHHNNNNNENENVNVNVNSSDALLSIAVKKGSVNKEASTSFSSKSDTSIGSSNFNLNCAAVAAAEFTTPTRRVAPPPTPPLGDGGSEILYTRRQTDVGAKRAREVVPLPFSPSPSEMMKEKTKAITRSASRPTRVEKAVEKGKGISIASVPFGSSSLENAKYKGNATAVSSSRTVTLNNIKDKGKAIATSSDDYPSRRSDKGKAVLIPLDCSLERTEHKGKSVAMSSSYLPPHKKEEKGMKELAVFSCPPLPRTKNTRKRTTEAGEIEPSKSWTDPHLKKRKTRCIRKEADSDFSLPRDFVEQQKAYFKEVDEFELLVEEISDHESDA